MTNALKKMRQKDVKRPVPTLSLGYAKDLVDASIAGDCFFSPHIQKIIEMFLSETKVVYLGPFYCIHVDNCISYFILLLIIIVVIYYSFITLRKLGENLNISSTKLLFKSNTDLLQNYSTIVQFPFKQSSDILNKLPSIYLQSDEDDIDVSDL